MKLTLTVLTIAATMFASSASAFDDNLTQAELNELRGKPMIGDLAVGVKGIIDASMGAVFCTRDGQTYLGGQVMFTVRDNINRYEIIREPDGGFQVTYLTRGGSANRTLPHLKIPCDLMSDLLGETTFFPVNSINGFTDHRSLIIDLVNQGYK